MADPFSIVVGSVGLADVCIKFVGFLRQAKEGFQKVDKDLNELSEEIIALCNVSKLIKTRCGVDAGKVKDADDQQAIESVWKTTHISLESCQLIVARLNDLISEILGGGKPRYAKFKNLRKYLRQQSKEDEFNELRQRLRVHSSALQTSLAAVNI